jgi:hypothetical protein
MVKASLASQRDRDLRVEIGKAIQKACSLVGWSHKELAGRLAGEHGNVDAWMVKLHAWISGERPAHFHALFGVEEFCQPLLLALTALDKNAEVTTEIRFRRIA